MITRFFCKENCNKTRNEEVLHLLGKSLPSQTLICVTNYFYQMVMRDCCLYEIIFVFFWSFILIITAAYDNNNDALFFSISIFIFFTIIILIFISSKKKKGVRQGFVLISFIVVRFRATISSILQITHNNSSIVFS